MNLRHLLPLAAAALPLLAVARPADPRPIPFTNADGSTTVVCPQGDCNFTYFTDLAGEKVLERIDGTWTQAMLNGRLLTTSPEDIAALRASGAGRVLPEQVGAKHRMAPIDNEGRTKFPTIGEGVHSLVVLIEFPDRKFTVGDPVQKFEDFCNKEGYDAYGSRGSARDYFQVVSDGQFVPTFDIVGPVMMKNNAAYYAATEVWQAAYDEYMKNHSRPNYDEIQRIADLTLDGAGKNARISEAIYEALTALDPEIDFSKYDYDGDGKIDTVFFFYAGYGQADYFNDKSEKENYQRFPDGFAHDCIWPHQADYNNWISRPNTPDLPPLTLDGKQFGNYACSNELNGKYHDEPYLDGIGAFCHEFGHVLGMPDFYQTQGVDYVQTPGNCDVMDKGSYNLNSTCPPLYSTYEKWVCRWLEFNELDAKEKKHIDISAVGSGKPKEESYRMYVPRVPMGTFKDEYFIFESRANEGFDAGLDWHGMLIWHIKFKKTAWEYNQVNTNPRQPGISIVPPEAQTKSGTGYVGTWPGPDNKYTYIAPVADPTGTGGNKRVLLPYAYSDMNPSLTSITYDAAAKRSSFDFNILTEAPGAPVMKTPTRSGAGMDTQVYLSWEPVEGATEYILSVYVEDNGENYYLFDAADVYGKLKDVSVGNVTGVWASGYSDEELAMTSTATVRAVVGLPSESASIQFKAGELSENTGVEDIIADGTVMAGPGCILAPAEAEVYNLQGMRVGRDNLPAGVYVVRLGDKSVKLMVR